MHLLAVEPYYGSSHRAFLDAIVGRSRHDWTLITGAPRHWKWRMRCSPLTLADQTRARLNQVQRQVDLVFCTDMLDLPQWRGLLSDNQWIHPSCPALVYFHENQWTYPTAPEAREDFHYGYTNLLTTIAANAVWFNSRFHQESFLKASEQFLKRMPDSVQEHDLASVRSKSKVIPAGFEPIASPANINQRDQDDAIVLGWVARWEADKRPDRFLKLLTILEQQNVSFELVLLGARPKRENKSLQQIRDRYSRQIRHDGFSEHEHGRWLAETDCVVSTADHEFFGIAVCEAIWAGAIPILPNRLSYPELASAEYLYDSLSEAATLIATISKETASQRRERSNAASRRVADYRMSELVPKIDRELETLL